MKGHERCKGFTHTKMVASDLSFPSYLIACLLSSIILALVLLTSFIRQSWNLGVAFLCFWLLAENVTAAINSIIWVDNADIKLPVYCDVGEYFSSMTYRCNRVLFICALVSRLPTLSSPWRP